MRHIDGFTSSEHYGGHGIVDHRRSITAPCEADGYEMRLVGDILIQDAADDEHCLTMVDVIEESRDAGQRWLRGIGIKCSWFPARHGRVGHVNVWIMGFSASHLFEMDTDDTFTACELLGLGIAAVEATYPTSAPRLA